MDNLYDVLKNSFNSMLSNVHTVTIARVEGVNATTINCKPVINRDVDGVSVELPLFIEVPIINIRGGGSYLAMPIAVGDYCLLIFTERCFDKWYIGQDFKSPLDFRMFDYSDGFALVGVNPLASAITIPTTTTIQGDLIMNGNLTVNGNIQCNGTITATVDVVGGGISLKNHRHGGGVPPDGA